MIYKLIPTCKDYIWGGTRLKSEYSKKSDSDIIAETWELSCHDDGPSYFEDGVTTLKSHIEKNPAAAGTVCEKFEDFPMLIKLIDAKQNLSIQVHPSDEYSRKFEGQNGKTEVWYVVDCEEDAFIYYGLNKDVTAEEFAAAIENDTVTDILNKVDVKQGDVFFIPSGTIHAIGAGCLIAEVQQNSNVTYRVYDYGRLGVDGQPRELHVKKACDVTILEKSKPQPDFAPHMSTCEYFTADLMQVSADNAGSFGVDASSFAHIMSLTGDIKATVSDTTVSLAKGESAFIDAASGEVAISGNGKVLISYIK